MCISIPGTLHCIPREGNTSSLNFTETVVSLEFISSAMMLSLLDLWIIASNIFVIVSLSYRAKKKFSMTRRLLVSQAVADLGLSLVIVPLATLRELVNFHSHLLFSHVFCRFWLSSEVILFAASLFTVAAIAIDRFLAVCYALNYGHLATSIHAHIIVFTPWCLAVLLGMPMFLFYDSDFFMGTRKHSNYSSNPGIYCTLRNCVAPSRFLLGTLSFFLPFIVLVFSSTKVLVKVLQNFRELNAGVLQNSCKNERKSKPASKSLLSNSKANKPRSSITGLRVHIGGQPYLMPIKHTRAGKKQKKNILSPLSSTVRCGMLIISTTPSQNPRSQREEAAATSSERITNSNAAQKRRNELTCQIGQFGDSAVVTPKNGLDCESAEVKSSSGSTRNLDSLTAGLTSAAYLKPPKWLFTGSPRKSDPEFSNPMCMRRCALRPAASCLHHSFSHELLSASTNSVPQNTSNPKVNPSQHSLNPSLHGYEQLAVPETSRNHRQQAKVICQFIACCGYILLGMAPFYVTICVSAWLPSETIPYSVFAGFYWLRFFTIALNPLVNGSMFDELRQSFRYLWYCGKPKQEKKALKRLVIAGLAAGGIPYGRPISPLVQPYRKQESTDRAKAIRADIALPPGDQKG